MSPREPPTDGELLRRAGAGDCDAFSVLYVRYETVVAGYLVRRSRDPELAADLTAETFAAAIVGARGFRDQGQPAVGWLLGIARNLLASSWQRSESERPAAPRGRAGRSQRRVTGAHRSAHRRVRPLQSAAAPPPSFQFSHSFSGWRSGGL
jgi:DNA-directed RNA polymerase specialized sigma24 family protein